MSEAVVFCGVQGSGKTTFYRERFLHTHVRISRDLLRTRGRERAFLAVCVETGQRFVVDNTNPTAADRRPYVEAALAAGMRPVAYVFDLPAGEALARNARREGRARIPVSGVLGTLARLEPPTADEGFAERWHVSPAALPVRANGEPVPTPVFAVEPLDSVEARALVERVRLEAALPSAEEAEGLLLATLGGLGARLSPAAAGALAAGLPPPLAAALLAAAGGRAPLADAALRALGAALPPHRLEPALRELDPGPARALAPVPAAEQLRLLG